MDRCEGIVPKSLPLLLLLLTSAVVASVLALKDHRWTDSFYILVTGSRDTVGLAIQVISAALGACQVFAVTSLINLSTRLYIQSRRLTQFNKLRFVAAITSGSSQALRTRLPNSWFALVLLTVVSLKIPAALWAGALTPILSGVTQNEGSIPVPLYRATTEELNAWQSGIKRLSNGTVIQDLSCTYNMTADWIIPGSFSFMSTCPAVDLIGTLLGSLATSAIDSPTFPQPHPRVDGSGWMSLGRSYGVGSSPGILAVGELPERRAPLLSFKYNETGYRADVSCLRNASSAFEIGMIADLNNYNLQLIIAQGTLPNSVSGQVERYVTTSTTSDTVNIVVWTALSNSKKNILAVAATGWYSNQNRVPNFDQMQYEVQFVPSQFTVHVNVTNTTITATPVGGDVDDIEPTGQFTASVFLALEQISRISGQNVISTLGTPLGHSAELLSKSDPTLSLEQVNTLALEAGVGRLLDSLLVANAHSQMLLLNTSTKVPIQVVYSAVKLGSDKYIFAALAINIAMLLAVIVEMIRTGLWSGLERFDPMDIGDAGIAISSGGTSIAEICLSADSYLQPSSGSQLLELTKQRHWSLCALPVKNEAEGRTLVNRKKTSLSALWTSRKQPRFQLLDQQS